MFPQYDEFGRPINHSIPLPYINQMPVNMGQSVGPAPQPQVSPIPNQIYSQIPEAPVPVAQPVNQPDATLARVVAPEAMTSQQGIQPVSPLPAQAALEAAPVRSITPPQINDSAYKNSKLRTVMNAIAGGLAGAAGGPKAGIETGSYLHDLKYNRAMQDYNTNLALTEKKVKSEEERQKVGNLEYLSPFKAEAIGAKANKDIASVGQTDRKLTAQEEENKSKELRRQVLNKKTQFEVDNPGRNPLEYKMNLSPEELKAAQEIEKEEATNKANAGVGAAGAKAAATENAKLDVDTKRIGDVATVAGARGQAVARGREVGAEQGRLQIEKMPENVKRIGQIAHQAIGNMDQFEEIMKNVDPRLKAATVSQVLDSKDLQNVLKPTQKTAVENSKVGLAHARTIQSLLDDPEIKGDWGPGMGRLEAIMSRYGGKSYADNATGDAEHSRDAIATANDILTNVHKLGITGKQQKLLTSMAYLVTFEASSSSGTRPSWQLINYLKEQSASPRMNMDRMQGALDGVVSSITNRVNSAFKKTEGGFPVGETKSTPEDDFWKDIKSKPVVKAPGGKP